MRATRCLGVALCALTTLTPAASAGPTSRLSPGVRTLSSGFRLTVARPSAEGVFTRMPTWTFAADSAPAGFTVTGTSASGSATARLQNAAGVTIILESAGSADVLPSAAFLPPGWPQPVTSIAPPGATVAADGSWTLDAETRSFGRFSPGSNGTMWVRATIYDPGGDVRTASPENVAAIQAAVDAFQPSLRVWYGLDPLTTSTTYGATVATAVAAAVRRTAARPKWSAVVDEKHFVQLGTRRIPPREVFAVREKHGKIAMSVEQIASLGIRLVHVPTHAGGNRPGAPYSWRWQKARRCWWGNTDYPFPLPTSERSATRYGPMSLPFLPGPDVWPAIALFGQASSITGAYDLTAKKPLVHANGSTRYEFYVYSGWRQHVIVDVDRHGIIRILKKESLDANGLVVEQRRLAITPRPSARLFAHQPVCA